MPLAPNYPIETARLRLRPFALGDREGLRLVRSDPETVRYLPFAKADDEALSKALETRLTMTALDEPDSGIALFVEVAETNAFAGDVLLFHFDKANRTAELGFSLARAHRGKGYVQEAARAIMAWGFGAGGLHRIVARCDVRNTASVRTLNRLGFRSEGHQLKNQRMGDEWADTLNFAVLKDEWVAP